MEKVVIEYWNHDHSDKGVIHNLYGQWDASIHLRDRYPNQTKFFAALKDAEQWMEAQGYKTDKGPETPRYMLMPIEELRAAIGRVRKMQYALNKSRVIALLEERLAELEAEEKQKETHHV